MLNIIKNHSLKTLVRIKCYCMGHKWRKNHRYPLAKDHCIYRYCERCNVQQKYDYSKESNKNHWENIKGVEQMKNEDKHCGLNDAHIRDFLAQQLRYGYRGEVIAINKHIAKLKENLKVAKRSEAAAQLIEDKGWERFDVSEEIQDYSPKTYFAFIGTNEEYKALNFTKD